MVTEDLDEILQLHSQRKNVIIAGIETHVCVLQSCLNFLARGYNVVIVADAVSSQRDYDREIALERMRKEGAIISTVESLLYELMVTSEHKEFKGILKYVKERNDSGEFF